MQETEYYKTPYFIVTVVFVALTLIVIRSILKNNKRLQLSIIRDKIRRTELPYFPHFCSSRAITCYVVTLIMLSAMFMSHAMPLQFMLFGIIAILLFFLYSHKLTRSWHKFDSGKFVNKLFITSLLIRIAYVIFIYYYYIDMTGKPHMYHAGDELWYQYMGERWHEEGFGAFLEALALYGDFDDSGYCWWLGLIYRIMGTNVLSARLIKCVLDSFSCVLIYSLAKRNFGENVARMASIFYMLIPNAWYYCGLTLKETEMTFIAVIFVERGDLALRFSKIKIRDLIIPVMAVAIMLAFRTALAAVMVAALTAAIILSSKKQLQTWKKILLSAVFGVWMFAAVGVELRQETERLWEGRTDNQEVGYMARSDIEAGGNSFAQYATATLFAPFIFTIPFSTMVHVPTQENQMMLNGACFIKNILSFFVVFALLVLVVRREWRQHVLPIAVMCGYLLVLVFSNFAHAERFHFPVLCLELMFAAYGVSQMTNKHKRWFLIWLVVVCLINITWTFIKLSGRGLI